MKVLKGPLVTNYYEFETKQFNDPQFKQLYMYKVTAVPTIPETAKKLWHQVLKNASRKLERDLKMITYSADSVWAEIYTTPFTISAVLDPNPKNRKKQQYSQESQGMQAKQNYQLTF